MAFLKIQVLEAWWRWVDGFCTSVVHSNSILQEGRGQKSIERVNSWRQISAHTQEIWRKLATSTNTNLRFLYISLSFSLWVCVIITIQEFIFVFLLLICQIKRRNGNIHMQTHWLVFFYACINMYETYRGSLVYFVKIKPWNRSEKFVSDSFLHRDINH